MTIVGGGGASGFWPESSCASRELSFSRWRLGAAKNQKRGRAGPFSAPELGPRRSPRPTSISNEGCSSSRRSSTCRAPGKCSSGPSRSTRSSRKPGRWYGFTLILEIDGGYSNDSSWLYKAEQELRRALQDDPDSARAHASLAALYFYQGRKDLIPEEAKKALALNPNEVDAKIWWSNYYMANGEYAPAIELVNQLLESDPLFFPARMILGDILRLEGDIEGAIRELGKILEQDPRNPYAAQKLARTYIDRNDLAAARRNLENPSPEDQRGFEIKLTWALLLALEGKTKEALEKMDEESMKYGALARLVDVLGRGVLCHQGGFPEIPGLAREGGPKRRRAGCVVSPRPIAGQDPGSSPLPANHRLHRLPPQIANSKRRRPCD